MARLDVVVLGGGAAGLAATLDLLNKEGIRVSRVPDRFGFASGGRLHAARELDGALSRVLGGLRSDRRRDRSFETYLRTVRGRADKRLARSFVRSFHGADTRRIGEKGLAEEPADAMSSSRPEGGYGRLVEALRRRVGPALRLGRAAAELAWGRGRVRVRLAGGGLIEAGAAIVTLPSGVLKAGPGSEGAVRFDPPLAAKRRALARLQMGSALRVVYRFEDGFWRGFSKALGGFNFLQSVGRPVPVWRTAAPLPLWPMRKRGPPSPLGVERFSDLLGERLRRVRLGQERGAGL